MNRQEIRSRLQAVFKRVFGVPSARPDCSPDTCDAWDSLAHLTLLLEVENTFSISLGELNRHGLTFAEIEKRILATCSATSEGEEPAHRIAILGPCYAGDIKRALDAYFSSTETSVIVKAFTVPVLDMLVENPDRPKNPQLISVARPIEIAMSYAGLLAEQLLQFDTILLIQSNLRPYPQLQAENECVYALSPERLLDCEDEATPEIDGGYRPAIAGSLLPNVLSAFRNRLREVGVSAPRWFFFPAPWIELYPRSSTKAKAEGSELFDLEKQLTLFDSIYRERLHGLPIPPPLKFEKGTALNDWRILDVAKHLSCFVERNDFLSFRPHHNLKEGPDYFLDTHHPIPEFYEYFVEIELGPKLFESWNIDVLSSRSEPPDLLAPISENLREIVSLQDTEALFTILDGLPSESAHLIADLLFCSRPDLRFDFIKTLAERPTRFDGITPAIERSLSEKEDVNLSPKEWADIFETIRIASHNLSIHSEVLARKRILLRSWKKCSERFSAGEQSQTNQAIALAINTYSLPTYESIVQAFQGARGIGEQVAKELSDNSRWVLWGANSTAKLILATLPNTAPWPVAISSGHPHEWGQTCMGMSILTPDEAKALNPEQIVLAMNPRTAEQLQSEVEAIFPEAEVLQAPFQERKKHQPKKCVRYSPRNSLQEALEDTSEDDWLYWYSRESLAPISYTTQQLVSWGNALLQEAEQDHGKTFASNDQILICLPQSPAVYAIFLAALARGCVPSMLSYPTSRRDPDSYQTHISAIIEHVGASVVFSANQVLTPSLVSSTVPIVNVENCLIPKRSDEPVPISRDKNTASLAFLQHSSGTTGIPKSVLLTEDQVLSQTVAYGESLRLSEKDRIASWLPLYHDMGLLTALVCPLLWRVPVAACDPQEWVDDPTLILDVISDFEATLCWWPNFAFSFMGKRTASLRANELSLHSVRGIVNCSEPLTNDAHQSLLSSLERFGLSQEKLASSYAMAETVFAVTQSPIETRPYVLEVSEKAFLAGSIKPESKETEATRSLVSSGIIIGNAEVRILDEQGEIVPRGTIGEIFIKSDSLANGYLNREEETNSAFQNGWYQSGDYGALWLDEEGKEQLFVTGRKKDLIIIAGRNLYPHDIEAAMSEIPGIRAGRVFAYGEFDPELQTERISIAAECDSSKIAEQKVQELSATIRNRMIAQFDINPGEVRLLPPKSLIKTSSGKLARRESRQAIEKIELQKASGRA